MGYEEEHPNMYEDVKDFHKKFGAHIEQTPTIPPPEVCKLRRTLIREEYKELRQALETKDLPEIAKESMDLVYVIMGTLVSYGINADEIWEEVQRTNMLKVGGANREDGKVLKPEGWQPPDIVNLLKKQGM